MILFKKTKFKNFLSTGNHYTEIDFTKNRTNLIIGTNGAGKCFCMDTKIKLRNKKTGEIIETTVGDLYDFHKKQNN